MKAGEAVFQQLLDGKIQYRVPLFQRTYSWEEENWQRLWDDILEIYSLNTPRSHFIGAIVTLPIPDAPEKCAKYLLIDGQQRLTTLLILLSAIRDIAQTDPSTKSLADQIFEECLINKYVPDEFEKIKPTQRDESAFRLVINAATPAGTTSIFGAYNFFRTVIVKGDLDGNKIDLTRLKYRITNYISLVSIRLDQDDSPHHIFESLNNTGADLTASDLVRNHIFMRIPVEKEQISAYNAYWFPMQQQTEFEGKSVLSGFFWRYLMKDGSLPRQEEVFEEMRKFIDSEIKKGRPLTDFLAELKLYSDLYIKMWRPNPFETSLSIQEQLIRLNQWEVEVTFPFILTALYKRHKNIISDHDLLQVLQTIEAYVVRRIVCGIPTNRLRRIFANMSGQVSDTNYVQSCRQYLMNNEWPSDKTFHEMFQSTRIYIPARLSRSRLILISLEHSYSPSVKVAISVQHTIEHIMPQTLNDAWIKELGPNAKGVHEKYLHTIGNLTLTASNSSMGNASFNEKLQYFNSTGERKFSLNDHIIPVSQWTEQEITSRSKELADQALIIWK